ncbi:hypothetical protein JNB_11694 [Janibacter sp. HTCC2649]|uniref:hypothetical protein n=1 Tax=Janibacter sp. HTCC2649 TaxID=313589 RepID=UPI0000670A93|nr:hypothetical protein [Janibacter sp. HTCC2649]EAQ00836.1 hypothetical protein JNB_11694 [Janibacter sp. HTCC2649]
MSIPTRAPGESSPVHPEVVRRLLRSEPFARSRRFAHRLDTEPVLLEELLDLVRLRHLENDERLAPLAGLVAQAVDWLGGSALEADDSAALVARRHMTLAALSYLVDFNDVIPDDTVGGTVDDFVVLDYVLTRALNPAAR